MKYMRLLVTMRGKKMNKQSTKNENYILLYYLYVPTDTHLCFVIKPFRSKSLNSCSLFLSNPLSFKVYILDEHFQRSHLLLWQNPSTEFPFRNENSRDQNAQDLLKCSSSICSTRTEQYRNRTQDPPENSIKLKRQGN